VIHFISPEFYGSVWHFDLTKMILGGAICWMMVGNLVMYRLVNFKI
jgi:tight adherence protein B